MSTVFVAFASTSPIEPFWWNTMPPASAAPSFFNFFAAPAFPSPNRFLLSLHRRLQLPRRAEIPLPQRKDLRRNTPPDKLETAAFHRSTHTLVRP